MALGRTTTWIPQITADRSGPVTDTIRQISADTLNGLDRGHFPGVRKWVGAISGASGIVMALATHDPVYFLNVLPDMQQAHEGYFAQSFVNDPANTTAKKMQEHASVHMTFSFLRSLPRIALALMSPFPGINLAFAGAISAASLARASAYSRMTELIDKNPAERRQAISDSWLLRHASTWPHNVARLEKWLWRFAGTTTAVTTVLALTAGVFPAVALGGLVTVGSFVLSERSAKPMEAYYRAVYKNTVGSTV